MKVVDMKTVETGQLEREVVDNIHRIIATTLDIKDVYTGIVAELRKLVDFDRASIALLGDEEGAAVTYVISAEYSGVALKEGEPYPLKGSVLEKAIITGRPVIVENTENDEFSTDSLLLKEEGIRSRLSVPLRAKENVLGSINLGSKRPDNFSIAHANLLEQVSPQLALATENTILFRKIRDSEEKYKDLYDNAPVLYCTYSMDGTILDCNQTAARLLGYTKESIVGEKISRFIFPEDREKAEKTLAEGHADDLGLRMVKKDGSIVDVSVSTAPKYDVVGNVNGSRMVARDVTEKKRAEDRLLQESYKVQFVVEALDIGLCLMNKELNITWANKKISEMWGVSEPVVGMACPEIFQCRDIVCPAQKAFERGEGRFHDIRILTKEGRRRYIENIAIPMKDTRGEVKRVLLLSMDITDREKRIHQLSLLSQLSDALQYTLKLEKVFQLVLTCVTAGHALGFNRAMLFLLNHERDAICGKVAIGPSNLEEAYGVWQEISKHPTFEGLLGDVVELKPLESELSIKTTLMAFPVSDDREIVVRCLKEKVPQVVGDANNDPRVTEEFRNAIDAKEFVCVPLMVKGKAIGVIVADNVYSAEPITEEHVHILNMFAKSAAQAIENAETYQELEDKMAQLTETQDRLLRAERLAAIGEMASYVAHEIRNPLVTIGGFARSIKRLGSNDENIDTSSKIIVQEVGRLERILDNIRDFTRPAEPLKARVHINKLMEDTLALTEGYLREKDIVVRKELGDDLPETLADPSQMKQVFLNLVKNAAESMTEGGILTVKTYVEENSIKIDFADTGEGVPSEIKGKLFTPFFTTKTGGTGVGLAICQKIVDNHEGKLIVSSAEERGSVFSVLLPVLGAEEEVRRGDKQ